MTASLLVLVSVALLVLISGFCFVGCVFDSHGTGVGEPPPPTPFTKYSDTDVKPTAVAYWPLSEASATADKPVAQAIAKDVVGNNDGNYTHKGNAPAGMFPCPPIPISAGLDSAPAIGFLSLGAVSLLPGDAVQPGNDPNVLTTGMQVDGGFVTVPFNGVINPTAKFTIECWARPEWSAGDPPAFRAAVDSRTINPGGTAFTGYAIVVNEAGNWEAELGAMGVAGFVMVTGGKAALSEAAHVVLTCDGSNATLFVNGVQAATKSLGGAFAPNTQSPLVIGVGGPWITTRAMGVPEPAFPLVPFKGTIQDVAIYSTVLADSDILTNFNDGSGKTTVPAG
jgi:hypothetical protein